MQSARSRMSGEMDWALYLYTFSPIQLKLERWLMVFPSVRETSLKTTGSVGTGKVHSINSRVAYICDRLSIKSDIKLLKIYNPCIERLDKIFINSLSNDQIPDSIVKGLMVRFIGFSMIDQRVGCGEIKI
jgi:hypothetical protein